MRGLFRLLASVVAVFFIVLFATLLFTFVSKVWFGSGDSSRKQHVTVLDLEGILITSNSFLRSLEEVTDNKATKAIVVRINSPGGVVAPSQEIFEALKKTDKKIPVVISMGSLAASGGYYISLGGRKIFCSPGTLTGSIGVIIEFINTEGLYRWAKVDRFALTAGKLKDAGSPWRAMKPEEKEYFKNLLVNIHGQFKAAVKERRNLSDAEVESVTDGRVFTGEQAMQAKLVDALGGTEDAIAEARKLAGLPDTAEVYYAERKKGILRQLWDGDMENSFRSFWSLLTGDGPQSLGLSSGWRLLWLAPVR